MFRRRIRALLSNTTETWNLAPPSPLGINNGELRDGEQEETARENTYEDRQTKRSLSRQTVEERIFYLPIDYKADQILGSGAFGLVIGTTIVSTKRRIAIKILTLSMEVLSPDKEKSYRAKSVCRELSLLRLFSKQGGHPNVIVLVDAFIVTMANQHQIMLVTNFMDTSLSALMKSAALTDRQIKQYFHQILCGLDYLHSNKIMHRDLKPANILVDGDRLCIADLGQARVGEALRDDLSLSICDKISPPQAMTDHGIGTFIYRAPELHFRCPYYSYPVDMWAAACILAEMFFKPNRTLFTAGQYGDNVFELISEYFQLLGTPTSPDDIEWIPCEWAKYVRARCSEQALEPDWSKLSIADVAALNLLQQILGFNPCTRITVDKALQHEYFNDTHRLSLQPQFLISPSLYTSAAELEQLTTTEEFVQFMCDEIKQMVEND